LQNPLRALAVAIRGPRLEGAFAAEIPLEGQRPAQYVFSENVQQTLTEMRKDEAQEKAGKKPAAKASPSNAAAQPA
jgi:hypothetical protein